MELFKVVALGSNACLQTGEEAGTGLDDGGGWDLGPRIHDSRSEGFDIAAMVGGVERPFGFASPKVVQDMEVRGGGRPDVLGPECRGSNVVVVEHLGGLGCVGQCQWRTKKPHW